MNDVNERLQEVEQWKAAADERIKTLFHMAGEASASIKAHTEATTALSNNVAVLSTQIAVLVAQGAARRDCPNPGMCKELSPRIDALEKKETAFVGSWKGVLFVFGCAAAFVSAAGGVIGIIKLLWAHKPPA